MKRRVESSRLWTGAASPGMWGRERRSLGRKCALCATSAGTRTRVERIGAARRYSRARWTVCCGKGMVKPASVSASFAARWVAQRTSQ